MIRIVVLATALAAVLPSITTVRDNFDDPLTKRWINNAPSRARIIDSRDPAHGNVLLLEPDGDDVYVLARETEGWQGGVIEGDMRFPTNDDNYLGIVYGFQKSRGRTDFGVIYIKGNESYAQANPHLDFNVSRTLYPEYRVPLTGTAAVRTGVWQHFKLEFVGAEAHLYVGDMKTPQMTFPFSPTMRGAMGLQPRSVGGDVWVDSVSWRRLDRLSYTGASLPAMAYQRDGFLTRWEVTGPFTEDVDVPARDGKSRAQWRPVAADARGAVITGLVNEYHGAHDVTYWRTTVQSDEDRDAALQLSTADDLALWVNGRFWWFVPRAASAWFDALTSKQHAPQRIPVRLKRGSNTLMVRVRGGAYATGGFFAAIEPPR